MSSIVISGDTSGTITIAAPAVSGTTTLTLPATTGTITTKDTNGILSVNGVQFPATQSASADANCLDDYEEGTFTPTDGSGASLGITFNNAKYTKIGRLVYISVDTIVYPSTASTATAVMASLPFTNLAANVASSALVSSNTFANRALVVGGTTTVFFYANSSISASTNVQLSSATIYGFSAVYQTS